MTVSNVEASAAKILDDILPVVPALAQKIPSKVRAVLYAAAPLALLGLGLIPGLDSTLRESLDAILSVVAGTVAVSNTPKA